MTEENKTQEMILYHVVPREFEWKNTYAMGGSRPNAKFVAREYDCQLEFREGKFRELGNRSYFPNFLEECGISSDGTCLSAVLVGTDREKLANARVYIHRTMGVKSMPSDTTINVSNKRVGLDSLFS